MLLVSQIIENKEKIIAGLEKKRFRDAAEIIKRVIGLDQTRRETQSKLDLVLADVNSKSREIGVLMKTQQKTEAERLKSETAELKAQGKTMAQDLENIEKELHELLLTIPNAPNDLVPQGATAEDNEIVYQGGTLPELPENAVPHWDLIEKYHIISFELGVKITGAGFPVYIGKGARLQRALINFFLDEAMKAGYTEIQPPILVNEDSGYGTGQLPDKEGQMYPVPNMKMYLIPTAEVPITNLYRDMILTDDDLPVRNVGYTPCFRSEAGSWGAHVRGLNRLHQFDKVEIVQVQKAGNSYKALDEMVAHVKGLLEKLELPFRIVRLCGGDLGFTSALTYDMEVYSGAQKKWLEVSSISNFETYQANRLKLRYKKEQKSRPELLHTLNGSALALPRIVAALLENNQTDMGIKIPAALTPYTGFNIIN